MKILCSNSSSINNSNLFSLLSKMHTFLPFLLSPGMQETHAKGWIISCIVHTVHLQCNFITLSHSVTISHPAKQPFNSIPLLHQRQKPTKHILEKKIDPRASNRSTGQYDLSQIWKTLFRFEGERATERRKRAEGKSDARDDMSEEEQKLGRETRNSGPGSGIRMQHSRWLLSSAGDMYAGDVNTQDSAYCVSKHQYS